MEKTKAVIEAITALSEIGFQNEPDNLIRYHVRLAGVEVGPAMTFEECSAVSYWLNWIKAQEHIFAGKAFYAALELVLGHEGGWSDNPADPGGATMKGVTLDTFRQHFGPQKTKEDLLNITDHQLRLIYHHYWNGSCKCDDLPWGVDYAVFDSAVNSGPRRAIKWLQRAVGVKQDGLIGPITREAIAAQHPIETIERMLDARLRFLESLPTWSTFGKGWWQRVHDVRVTATEWAKGAHYA